MKLFVYGTLKRNFRAHRLMERAPAAFLREVVTAPRYQLYDVGSFPGLFENPDIVGGVHGELYEVPESAFRDLDNYECVNSGLFRRGEVELEDGSKALAYFICQDVKNCTFIENGIWEKGGV